MKKLKLAVLAFLLANCFYSSFAKMLSIKEDEFFAKEQAVDITAVFPAKHQQNALPDLLSVPEISSIEILPVETNGFPEEIRATVFIKDEYGNHISGLKEKDFTFLDNDYKITDNSCFEFYEHKEKSKTPLDVVFIVDNSGSMRPYMDMVKANMEVLIRRLASDYKIRVGLMRYGIAADAWYFELGEEGETTTNHLIFGLCEDEGDPFWNNFSKELNPNGSNQFFWTDDQLEEFIGMVWEKNTDDGWYEPSWEVLYKMANDNDISYREGAQKVFILLGNEPVMDGINQYACHNESEFDGVTHLRKQVYTQQKTIEALQRKNIQAFMITATDEQSEADYKPIAERTNAAWLNIQDDYTSLMEKIATKIEGNYTISYCLDKSTENIGDCRTLTISNESAKGSICYTPSINKIYRTSETELLDNVSQPQFVDVTVGVTVCADTEIEYVTLYYKHGSPEVETFTSIIMTYEGNSSEGKYCHTYTAVIPASVVDSPLVEYKFEAFLKDRSSLVSIPVGKDYDTWKFTVMPNFPPTIEDVEISLIEACSPITITATIKDVTNHLDKAVLYYRIKRTPNVFDDVLMTRCKECGEDIYRATIPAEAVEEAGLLYHILALDDYGAQAWYGTPEKSMEINLPKAVDVKDMEKKEKMTISINRETGLIKCEMLKEGDILKAYFMDACGKYQELAGMVTVDNSSTKIELDVYGYKGDYDKPIQLRIAREKDFDYILPTSIPLLFNSSNTSVGSGVTFNAASIPGIEITYGNQPVFAGSDMPAVNNGTDYGTSAGISHTFTITNSGCAQLTVNDISLTDSDFSLSGIAFPVKIPSNGTQTFDITYTGEKTSTAGVTVKSTAFPRNYEFVVTGRNPKTMPATDCDMEIEYGQFYPTRVVYYSDKDQFVTMKIYDIAGNLKMIIFGPEILEQGNHAVYFLTKDLEKGWYSCVIETSNKICRNRFEISK